MDWGSPEPPKEGEQSSWGIWGKSQFSRALQAASGNRAWLSGVVYLTLFSKIEEQEISLGGSVDWIYCDSHQVEHLQEQNSGEEAAPSPA